jgi:hypothetical protein
VTATLTADFLQRTVRKFVAIANSRAIMGYVSAFTQAQGMRRMKREQLVDAASELNTVLSLDPEIDVKAPTGDLRNKIKEALTLVQEDDDISDETKVVLQQLGQKRASKAEAAEADDGAVAGNAPGTLRGKYKGSLKEFADNLMLQGATWEDLLKQTVPEAEKRGVSNLVKKSQLKRLAKERQRQGFKVEMDDERVKMYPRG